MATLHESAIPTDRPMRRADLAQTTGCNLETIRYYETTGILPPPARTHAGHRTYGAADVLRLSFVIRARELGFSLDDIRGLLGLGDGALRTCAEVQEKTRVHLSDVRTRIADLQRIEAELSRTAASCSGDNRPDCAILESLWQPRSSSAGSIRETHGASERQRTEVADAMGPTP